LLAEDVQATQAHNSICARTSAAAAPESLQVADRSSKVISGQKQTTVS
ncbi:MAG: hypothetical protein QOH63_1571, partial [Acidobacteriota bacterium]|nr:hypothetical protein [Acidobacteriota bacterium]